MKIPVHFREILYRETRVTIPDLFRPSKIFDFRLSGIVKSRKFPANAWPYFLEQEFLTSFSITSIFSSRTLLVPKCHNDGLQMDSCCLQTRFQGLENCILCSLQTSKISPTNPRIITSVKLMLLLK